MPRPFLLVGAAPGQPTGTSRIATEIARTLWDAREALDIDLLHLGWVPYELPVHGIGLATDLPWPVWAFQEGTGDFGMRAAQVATLVRWPGARDGIVMAVEDPARAFSLLPHAAEARGGFGWQRWGYFTVDGENRNGTIGGPAGEAIARFDRLLAHTEYGASVLAKAAARMDTIPFIPHGVDLTRFRPAASEADRQRQAQLLNPLGTNQRVVGCVCTNEARKDLALVIETLARLKADGVRGWLHIDREVGDAWSVPQLAADAGLDWQSLSVTHNLTDRELALCYHGCSVTIAPGRGESFGYPIIESLASGTPCLHVDYAGGATLLPPAWRVVPMVFQQTGPYGILRPFVEHAEMADAVRSVLEDVHTDWRSIELRCLELARAYDVRVTNQLMVDWVRAGLQEPR